MTVKSPRLEEATGATDGRKFLGKIAQYAPKGVRRNFKNIAAQSSWPDYVELPAIGAAVKFRKSIFFLGDHYLMLDDESYSWCAFASYTPDYHRGHRCNELIGPHFSLDDKSLRRLFNWIDTLIRLSLCIEANRYISGPEVYEKGFRLSLQKACKFLSISDDTICLLHLIFDTRIEFAHSPVDCEEIAYRGVPLKKVFSERSLHSNGLQGLSFIGDAFLLTTELIAKFKKTQHLLLDEKILRVEFDRIKSIYDEQPQPTKHGH